MFDAGPTKHDNIAWIIALAEISTQQAGSEEEVATERTEMLMTVKAISSHNVRGSQTQE